MGSSTTALQDQSPSRSTEGPAASRRPKPPGRHLGRVAWSAVAVVVAIGVLIAAIFGWYLPLTSRSSPGCATLPHGVSNFTAGLVKPNGTISILLNEPTIAAVDSIEANASSTALVVLNWSFSSNGSNATLHGYVEQLRQVGLEVLGYVPASSGAPALLEDYSASGLNGVYVPSAESPPGPCTLSDVVADAHHLGGFVVAGGTLSGSPQPPPTNVSLELLTYPDDAWTPDLVQSLQPLASRVAVVVENVSPQLALFVADSLHAIGVHYFLITQNSTGSEPAPVPNQSNIFNRLYETSRIFPVDWIASFSGMEALHQSYANGTVYFLLQNSSYNYSSSVWTTNYRILAVNLSFGDPLFETPTVSVESNNTNLTGSVASIGTEGAAVYFVDVESHTDLSTGVVASNVTTMTAGFSQSSGALLWQSNHSQLVASPMDTGVPWVFPTIEGTVVTDQMIIFEPSFVGIWVTTADAISGNLIDAHLLSLYSAPNNQTIVVGTGWDFGSWGPYAEDFGSYTIVFNSTQVVVPYTLLIGSQATAVFQNRSSSPLTFFGQEVYYLSRTNNTTWIESYNLTSQRSNVAVNIGNVTNLTGAIGIASGLYVVVANNGTYLAYDGAGRPAWETQVPTNPDDALFLPVNLGGNRILVGASIDQFSVATLSYFQEFWVLNATTGRPIEFHNESYTIVPVGNPPSLPSPLPPAYEPWGMIDDEFEFWSWDEGGYYFVNTTP